MRYHYNKAGILVKADDPNTRKVHWEAKKALASGKPTEQKPGTHITVKQQYDVLERIERQESSSPQGGMLQDVVYDFDRVGNLTLREDKQHQVRESFRYDTRHRLFLTTRRYQLQGKTYNVTLRNRYDGHGNLLSKDNGPTQQYDPKRLHQLTQVDGERYQYDEAGNQISGGGREIKWTSYNQPFEIKKTDGSSRLRLAYNADRLRMVKEDKTQGKITWYSGGGRYERIRERDGSEVHKYHLSIGGQAVMYLSQYISAGNTLRAAHTRYLLNDHLGSPMVVTDTHNHALQHLSFNAWGQRRYATWGDFLLRDPKLTLLLEALDQYALTRGFTGHEHDDEVGLIHMKGRLYDPQLGRFISADPFVQAPTNTQSYNRYSYVMNNPLSYTDPSGYFFSKLLGGIGSFVRRWGRTVAAVAVGILIPTAIIGPAGFAAVGPAKAILAGAAGGFASGLVSSGSLSGALRGAAFGAVTAGFARGVADLSLGRFKASVAHGVAQGAVSRLQGGKFTAGFFSSFLSHVTGKGVGLAGTLKQAAIGGTISELVGGKFANGAITAAFVHMFNELKNAHPKISQRLADDIFNNARQHASEALAMLTDVAKGDAQAKAKYERFFGKYSQANFNRVFRTIRNVIDLMDHRVFTLNYDVNPEPHNLENLAYYDPVQPNNIFFTPLLDGLIESNNINELSMTLFHEYTHPPPALTVDARLNSGVDAYGLRNVLTLAKENAFRATTNADSYVFYAYE